MLITDRGRRVSNKLDQPQDFSQKRGVLELHSPKHDITTRTRRQSSISTLRETPQQPLRTRSQKALAKNIPYVLVVSWGSDDIEFLSILLMLLRIRLQYFMMILTD